MSELRPVRTLGRATMVLLGMNAAMSLATIPSALMQQSLLERIALGDFTQAEIAANDAREAMLGFVGVGLYLVTAIVFLTWFYRAYANTEAFGHARAHGAGWAVGAWFVPILGLFRPYQIAREIWHASDPDASETSAVEKGPPLLLAWWIFWILSNFLGQASMRLSMSADSPGEWAMATTINIAVDVVELISAPLALLVVREITRRQEIIAARFDGAVEPLTF